MEFLSIWKMRLGAGRADRKRDRGLTTPADILRADDLPYGPDPRWNLLDLYRPKNAEGRLPVIVSFHGGGYVYGTKEVYQFYCMHLARQGFAVVNFNYPLAPKVKFPAPLREANAVLEWVCAHAEEYGLDLNNVFMVGDSAGGQMTSQYAAIWANPDYARVMGITPPPFRLAAVGLNCGMYDLMAGAVTGSSVVSSYFGPDPAAEHGEKLNVLAYIDGRYPPAYLLTAANDFLREACEPMGRLLRSKGVPAEWKIYGEAEDPRAGHVFHCDIRLPLGLAANRDELAFFQRFLR